MKSYVSGKLLVKPRSAKLTRDTELLGYSSSHSSKMDPFVRVKVGDQTFTSGVHKKGGKTPSWSDVFEYARKTEEKITFEVLDKDKLKDDLVGAGSLDIAKICGKSQKSCSEVVKIYYKDKESGELAVDIDFYPDSSSKGGIIGKIKSVFK
eukprot:TRINITY_DN3375_c0_g1_i6.p2 TRINITY_DN3375_c0_g1~~TRINITY_DN3375_c0_g1_i6.p2  ORF type:complete len:151 (+),score=44.81 TRINITY_DN3375_c0_g1_i6:856-1308(+)